MQIICILLTNIFPLFTRLINITLFISFSPHNTTILSFIPVSSIRIHKVHRIVITECIRRNAIILLRKGIRGHPAAESRAVLARSEVGVVRAEVRVLVFLAGVCVSERYPSRCRCRLHRFCVRLFSVWRVVRSLVDRSIAAIDHSTDTAEVVGHIEHRSAWGQAATTEGRTLLCQ